MPFTRWEEFLEAQSKSDDADKQFDKARKNIAPLDEPNQPVAGYGRKPKEINPNFAPPQGKNVNPYTGPNAKNNTKPFARVAEKWDNPIASMASPPFDDIKAAVSNGEKPDYKNLTAEEFLNKTKDMSDVEFVNEMLNENKKNDKHKEDDFDPSLTCQFTGKKAIPAFYEVSKYASRLFPENEKARKAFVRELKSVDGGLQKLLEELLGHKETYHALVGHMSDPESKVSKRFVNAMHEPYMEYVSSLVNPLGEAVDLPVAKRRPDMSDYKNSFDEPAPSEPHIATDDDDAQNAGMSGGLGPDDNTFGMMKTPDDGTPAEVPNDSGPNSGAMDAPPPPSESKREFAYHHLIREMGKYDHMKNYMSEYLM